MNLEPGMEIEDDVQQSQKHSIIHYREIPQYIGKQVLLHTCILNVSEDDVLLKISDENQIHAKNLASDLLSDGTIKTEEMPISLIGVLISENQIEVQSWHYLPNSEPYRLDNYYQVVDRIQRERYSPLFSVTI